MASSSESHGTHDLNEEMIKAYSGAMTSPLDEKGMEAAMQAMCDPNLIAGGIDVTLPAAIRAYLSAAPAPDELQAKLRHQHETVGVTPELRAAKEAYDAALPDELEVVGYLFDLRYGPDHWSTQRMFSKRLPSNPEDARNVEPLVRRSQAHSTIAALRAKDAQRLDHIKKLERRIHNQRRSNRDTWEIVEARNNWLGSPRSRQAYVRLLASFRNASARLETADAEVKRLTELAERLKLEAQGHASEAKTANSTIYEIYQVLSGGKGEPGNWNGAEPARRYVETAEAERDALRKALDEVDLPVTDQELVRLNNMCVSTDGEVKISVKMLHLLATHAIAFRAARKAMESGE